MSHDRAFIMPVVVDETREEGARVPDSFLAVQWTRLTGGGPPAAFCARVQALLESGTGVSPGSGNHGRDAHATPAEKRSALLA